MRRLGVVALAVLALSGLSGCAQASTLLQGAGVGCDTRQGFGPRDQGIDPPGIPLAGIAGLTPVGAAAAAAAQGQVTVFRLDGTACVCVPPGGYGPVQEGWWGSNGVLYIDLQDVRPQGIRLFDGTGC